MFEKLLEQILSRIIGEYVEGISKDQIKVGILGGNVEIKNLTIKKNIIQQFNLPFDLNFGMIEEIKLKIPWTSIQSSPVIAYLRGLYITVTPKDQSTWDQIQKDMIISKHQLLVQYAETLKDTITEKLKLQDDGNKDQGYFAKLVQKIVDNLQITIKDVHIRLESNQKMDNMSLGVTLDTIDVFTCDQNWKKKFLDDSKGIVYKKFILSNFYIYFNSNEKNFLNQNCSNQEEFLKEMKSLIFREENKDNQELKKLEYLLNFSTTGRMIQTKITQKVVDEKIPNFDIEISLDQTNFSLSKNQVKKLQQVLNIFVDYTIFQMKSNRKFEYYGFRPTRMIRNQTNNHIKNANIKEWWKFAIKYAKGQVNEKDKKWMLLTKKKKEGLQNKFMYLYESLLKTEEKSEFQILRNEDKRFYENVLMTVNNTVISSWIEEKVKKEKIDEQLAQEKKKKQGYFGWFKQSKELDEDEKKQIEAYVQDIMEAEQEQDIELTYDYPKIKFKLIQNKFSINLQRQQIFGDQYDQIGISTKELQVDFYMQEKGFILDLGLNNFQIQYQKINQQNEVLFNQEILDCLDQQISSEKKFVKIHVEDQPQDYKGLDKKIKVILGSINFIYNKDMMDCIGDIFTFDKVNDDLTEYIKSTTKQKIRQAQDITEQAMKNFIQDQPTFMFEVVMSTPQIILPVDQQNILKSQCWVFHPGNLYVKGDTFSKSEDKIEQMYDNYSVSLQDISMIYCENIQNLLSKTSFTIQENEKELYFTIFDKFNINVDVKMMKQVFVRLNLKDTRTIVNANLNALEMNFDRKSIKNLKEITQIFIDEGQKSQENAKKIILSNAQKQSHVYITINEIKHVYYQVIHKNFIYVYKNPQIDYIPLITLDIENLEFEFLNGTNQIIIKNTLKNSDNYLMEYENELLYEQWKGVIVKKLDQIKERKKYFSKEIIEEKQSVQTMDDDQLIKHDEIDDEINNIQVFFSFENLIVNIFSKKINYTLCTSNLSLELKQTTKVLNTYIELKNFTFETDESGQKEYLLTSNYEQSLACQIFKENYIQEQEKLIIIEFEQRIVGKDTFQKAKILFGSVFFDIETKKLNNLMKVLMDSESNLSQSQQSLPQVKIEENDILSNKTLEIYNKSTNKINNPEKGSILMEIEVKIQAINVLLINEIKDIPMNDLIIKNSQIEVIMKKGYMEVDAKFNDMVVYDLTNYPNTLTERNLALIKPQKMFGICDTNQDQTLVHAQFVSKDPLLVNIDDDLVNGKLTVKIQDILIDFHMQVVFRMLGFLTDQLLPALNTSQDQNSQPSLGYISKKQAFINIFKPFWQKMDIVIENTQCNFTIDENQSVLAYLQKLKINNQRFLNKNRLIQSPQRENQILNSIQGIWNDQYVLQFQELNCVLIENKIQQKLTSGLNMIMKVEMALFDLEYKTLYQALKISNYEQKYLKTNVVDTTHKQMFKQQFYFDNTISVDMQFSSFIAMIGNREYAALMGVLESCVTKNDGLEHLYIKDFQRKEELKEPMSLYVNIGMENIALVTLDNKNENRVFSKMFVRDLNIRCAMFQSGQMVVKIGIQDMKGSHLLKNKEKYYEKGFIGDFSIRNVYEPKDNEELKNLFIQELQQQDIQKNEILINKKCFTLSMEDDKQRNIEMVLQNLQILAQLDVLLHLSAITTLEAKKIPEPSKETKESSVQQPITPPVQLVMNVKIEILNNFFVLTDSNYDNCVVAKGDIILNLTMNPELKNKNVLSQKNFETAQENIKLQSQRQIAFSERNIQKEQEKKSNLFQSELFHPEDPYEEQIGMKLIRRDDEEVKEGLMDSTLEQSNEQNKQIGLDMSMKKFQCFITKFIDIFDKDIEKVPKREIILPWTLDLNFEQFVLYKETKEYPLPSKYNIMMVKALINEIELKIADDDAQNLLSIMNYHLLLMGPNEQPQNENQKQEDIEENFEEEKQEPNIGDLFEQKNYIYVSFNIINHIKITLVHQFNEMFVPNFVIKLKQFKIAADVKEQIKALIAFGIYIEYFNSDIFKWEPFIESSNMKLEYETLLDDNIQGKNIRIINPSKQFNINFSIPFIQKVLYLQNTSNKLQEQQLTEIKELKEDILVQNLDNLKYESELRKKGEKTPIKERVFVSPVSVHNQTGYNIEITYYKKLVLITEDNVPQMKNIYSKSIPIKNGDKAPLSIEDEKIDQDDEDFQEGFTQKFEYKFFSFKILHPSINLKKVSSLNLEQNFSKKIILDGDQKHVRHLSVLYNAQNIDEMKQIKIISPIQIENCLRKTVNIIIKQADIKHQIEIKPGQSESIKFDLLYFLTYFFIENQEFNYRYKKLDHFIAQKNGYYQIMTNREKNYNFVLKLIRNEENPYLSRLVLLPGFGFKNLLPVPIQLTILNQKDKRNFEMYKHQQIQISDFDISVKIEFSVKVQGFLESRVFTLVENQKLNYPKQIALRDMFGNKTYFNLIRLKKDKRHFEFALFSDLILINETNFFFNYQSRNVKENKKYSNIAGQTPLKDEEDNFDSQIILLSCDQSEVILQVQNDKYFYSNTSTNSLITQGIGAGVIHQQMKKRDDNTQKDYFLEIGYKSYIYNLDEEEYITSKIIQLVPKTILYNKTKHSIKLLNQSQLQDNILKPEEKQPVFIYDVIKDKNKYLDFEIQIDNKRYRNITALNLNTAGSSLFAMLNQTGEMFIMRVETIIQQDYVVINFLDRNEKNDLILSNKTPYPVQVYQRGQKQHWIGQIPENGQIESAFIDPYNDLCFVFQFYNHVNNLIFVYEAQINSISEDAIEKTIYQQQVFFSQQLLIQGESRVIQIMTQNKAQRASFALKKMVGKNQIQKIMQKSDFTNFFIEISDLGISLISQFNNVTMEIFYIYMNKMTLMGILTDTQREIQFAINYLNIDNNYYTLSKYPVFLTSQLSLKQTLNEKSKFLNFHCVQNINESQNLLSFDVIQFQIMPFVITTEDILFQVLMSLQEQFGKVFNTKGERNYIEKYFIEQQFDTQSLVFLKNNHEWEIVQFRTSHTWFYCKKLQIAQMQIILSLGINQLSDLKINTNMNVNNLLKTIGITFISVDESPLTFPNLELFSLFESFEGFQNIMMTHFKDTMRMNIAKILGNLDIIGNPVSLFSNIAGGFKAVYQKPKEGFVQGPLEGVVGIGKGGVTLVQATTTSAFKAVSKMSNSLASGLTSLAMDDKYLRERNIYRARKPQNVFEGVGKGFYSIGKGVFSGIKGVFTKPVDEMQKSGAQGFFKGMMKGVGGLITKPIGGVFDAVSLTAEGTKRTLTMFDDKSNEQKQRYPRVFYGEQRYFKKYNTEDAQIMKSLFFVEHKKFENDTFLDSIKLQQFDEKNFWYFVLTQENLILMKNDFKKVIMYCEIRNIVRVVINNREQLKIIYIQNNESQEFQINNTESKIGKILKSINYARYLYYTKISHK